MEAGHVNKQMTYFARFRVGDTPPDSLPSHILITNKLTEEQIQKNTIQLKSTLNHLPDRFLYICLESKDPAKLQLLLQKLPFYGMLGQVYTQVENKLYISLFQNDILNQIIDKLHDLISVLKFEIQLNLDLQKIGNTLNSGLIPSLNDIHLNLQLQQKPQLKNVINQILGNNIPFLNAIERLKSFTFQLKFKNSRDIPIFQNLFKIKFAEKNTQLIDQFKGIIEKNFYVILKQKNSMIKVDVNLAGIQQVLSILSGNLMNLLEGM